MKNEPVLTLAVLAAIVIAVLQGLLVGDIDSIQDVITIALPIVFGVAQRQLVTPTSKIPSGVHKLGA